MPDRRDRHRPSCAYDRARRGDPRLQRNHAYWGRRGVGGGRDRRPAEDRDLERRHRVPPPHRAAQPQDAVARVVGLLRGQRRTPTSTTSSTTRSARRPRSSTCSPLYKYRGPRAATPSALVDRVITRDATKLKVGQVYYTPWCDEHGKVIDDGTVHRLAEDDFRWTAADPQFRWLTHERPRPRRRDRGRHRGARRGRPPGSLSPGRPRGGDRRVVRRPALLPPPRVATLGRRRGRRQPDRLHRRPGLRAVDPGRRARSRSGTR